MRTLPAFSTLFAVGVVAVTLTAVAPSAAAAPSTGSAGSSSGSASACAPRSDADRLFLRESYFDDEDCDVQDAGIQLAHSQCRWLDVNGNSAANRIELAESTRDTLEYPYIFLHAAIEAYCPRHKD
ncbi:DUF732 domain-containing protein [Nocardia sp. NPDC023988]|uniref:DUF732 domain-containing protein n=1 Tax=unclassified Nocardia TaxID=2637762 RepID=UPI0033CFB2D7